MAARLQFGVFEFDPAAGTLWREGSRETTSSGCSSSAASTRAGFGV